MLHKRYHLLCSIADMQFAVFEWSRGESRRKSRPNGSTVELILIFLWRAEWCSSESRWKEKRARRSCLFNLSSLDECLWMQFAQHDKMIITSIVKLHDSLSHFSMELHPRWKTISTWSWRAKNSFPSTWTLVIAARRLSNQLSMDKLAILLWIK